MWLYYKQRESKSQTPTKIKTFYSLQINMELSQKFKLSVTLWAIILFIIMISVPIICCYLYTLVITNNYLKICSLLKGVKKNNEFKLKETSNKKKLGGLINKELLSLLNNSWTIPLPSSYTGLTFLLSGEVI